LFPARRHCSIRPAASTSRASRLKSERGVSVAAAMASRMAVDTTFQ
jgi:hypothetical protein